MLRVTCQTQKSYNLEYNDVISTRVQAHASWVFGMYSYSIGGLIISSVAS